MKVKTKVTKYLFWGGIAAAGYFLLMRFSNAILVDFVGIKWLGNDGLKLRFALKYNLTNNNDVSATVSSFKGKLLFGDYKMNDVEIPNAVTVAAGDTERLEVMFSVSPGILLAEILRYVQDRSGLKKFKLRGVMTGKIGEVPWVYPVNEILQLAE